MFKKNEFKAVLARAETSMADAAKALNINVTTLTRKITGESDFYRAAIEQLRILLGLDWDEVCKIFFAPDVE